MRKLFLLLLIPFLCSCEDHGLKPNSDADTLDVDVQKRSSGSCLSNVVADSALDECGRNAFGYSPLVGLYFDSDTAPAAHRAQGVIAASTVVPLNDQGQPSSTGKIYIDFEGHSNALRIADGLKAAMAASSLESSKIRLRNLAQGGIDLQEWVEVVGVGTVDVRTQIVIMHHSLSKNFSGCDSSAYVDATLYYLRSRLVQLIAKYPNLKIVYAQSRELGAWKCYGSPGAAAEPAAWLNGFAVREFVDLQVAGFDTLLSYENAPFIAWGFNPWSATTPRSWFETGGLHPCTVGSGGAAAWGQQWYNFLLSNSSSRPWFAANP